MKQDSILNASIAYYRKLNDFTQEDLAEKVGVSCQAVSKWEQQLSCPGIMLLPALADTFHISIDELFGIQTDRTPVYNFVPDVPWPDDGKLRFSLYHGKKLTNQSSCEYSDGKNSVQFRFHGGSHEIVGNCKFTCTETGK